MISMMFCCYRRPTNLYLLGDLRYFPACCESFKDMTLMCISLSWTLHVLRHNRTELVVEDTEDCLVHAAESKYLHKLDPWCCFRAKSIFLKDDVLCNVLCAYRASSAATEKGS